MADITGLDIATLLARAGGAISQDGSWQQNLASAAGETAANEQERKYLSQMIGGNVPDPTGRFGLDPDTILRGMQLRHQIEQSRPKPVQMTQVETPWGVETVPTEEVHEYRRKIFNEQNESTPSTIRTFQEYQKMDDDTKKAFDEFSKRQRGKSFEQVMAEFLIKRREAAKQDKELEAKLELGTEEHKTEVMDRFKDADISRRYAKFSDRLKNTGGKVPSRGVYKEMLALNEMAKEIEDRRDDVSEVRYERGSEGEGFYGTTSEGERILIQKFQRSAR